ncbi:MAG: membrane protein insertion efficiency factor YidD [Desulfobacteraceae bacterium]|nr:membrane protein insertion efficiency factor YidD [Desulfobacteraceae bacterium]
MILLAACAGAPRTAGPINPETGPLNLLIRIYRGPLDHLSAVRTGRCPMYPSCSHYAQAAIEKHGPLLGSMMACDRLIRCGREELAYAPKIPVNGKWRYNDPVSANDFWFSPGQYPPEQ